jgi:NitT/TauT family transport system permease protein
MRFAKGLGVLLPGVVLLTLWQMASSFGEVGFFVGQPSRVGVRIAEELSNGRLLSDIAITASQAVLGLAIGGAVGGLFGCLLGMNKALRRMFNPYVDALGVIPPIAFGPLAVLVMGTGFGMKAGFATLSAGMIMLGYAFVGVANLDPKIIEFAKSCRPNAARLWSMVILPASLNWIAGGARAALGAALVGAFVGQLISSSDGLGHRIQRSLGLFDIDGVWVGIFGFVLLGIAITGALVGVTRILTGIVRHRI